jgi:hypothetical protein
VSPRALAQLRATTPEVENAYDRVVEKRAELVTRLVRTGPLPPTELERLHSFGWDSDVTLVVLTIADARAVLCRHANGELSTDELVQWANQIEAREDITFEVADEKALGDLIFELANPSLHTEPTSAVAERWLAALG